MNKLFFFFFFDEHQHYLLGDGRIGDIIFALKQKYGTDDLSTISASEKLDYLCGSLNFTRDEFDLMIASNSPVMRTVKGHAFEVAMEYIYKKNGISIKDVGGDGDVDHIVNGHTIQLKTPNMAGTTSTMIEYKTHKTHGAKSENESMEYYHDIDSFAEYFMGLISYQPLKVFIIPKQQLERHPLNRRYIKSPFKVPISKTQYINNFQELGIKLNLNKDANIAPLQNELLPRTSHAIGLKSEIIIDTILREENFRIWDMSIRGFAREIALKRYLDRQNVKYVGNPVTIRPERGDKSDIAIRLNNGKYTFVQVKGVSTNNCAFQGIDSILATETQLTRGRVNDHPTQSRLYLATDFDYLMLCLDPAISYKSGLGEDWFFAMIPSSELRRHGDYPRRYSSMQHFSSRQLAKYELTPERIAQIIAG